jgi:hypothetical protein
MTKTSVVLAAVVAAVFAATASAAPSKGKPPTTGANCKPAVAVVLKGTLTAAGSATLPFGLSVNVTSGNKHSAAWRKLTQPVSIQVTSTTKINRQGHHSSTDLLSGDRVVVQARACKADTVAAMLPSLTAVRVTAHPAATK